MMRFASYGSSVEVIVDPVEIRKLAPMPALIEALATAFRSECTAPPRTIVAVPGGVDRLLASMPAFDDAGAGAVQLATLYPGNASVGLPTVQAVIVLFSANGTPEAIVDGTTVTRLRTAGVQISIPSRQHTHGHHRHGRAQRGGDLLQPLGRGVIRREHIGGELSDLVHGRVDGRTAAKEIILFKSVGSAIEDLAAARMIVNGRRNIDVL